MCVIRKLLDVIKIINVEPRAVSISEYGFINHFLRVILKVWPLACNKAKNIKVL